MVHFNWSWVLTLWLAASPTKTTPPDAGPAAEASAGTAAGADAAAAPDADQAAWYRKALPDARTFVAKRIDAHRLAPADKDNTTYYQALDARGQPVGFVREFTGPVSTAGLCPCNPLVVTLVFAADLRLLDILTRAPLQKWGHEPMTEAEQQHAIAVAKNPPARLLEASQDDIIDVTTGATRQAYAPMVVSRAALSTRRLVGLVQDTREILRGAPASSERQRVAALFVQNPPAPKLALSLAELLPELHNAELQQQVYQYLAHFWLTALQEHAAPDALVEERLLNPRLLHARGNDDVAQACYAIADAGLRPDWVRRCVKRLEKSDVAAPYLTLLQGTERFLAGDMAAALPQLQSAAGLFRREHVPMLHWRLARAAQQTGNKEVACRVARDLFAVHPLLPDMSEVLAACPDATLQIDNLRRQNRQAVLRGRRAGAGPVVRPAQVRDAADKSVKLALWDKNKVSVVMFFATWCAHCQKELPRVNAYAEALGKNKQVQVLGVRTGIDRETQSWESFKKQADPKFPVYTDQPDSRGLAEFSQQQNIPMGLPCVAVIDRGGVVRYILEPGDWRDTQRELEWAVQSLL